MNCNTINYVMSLQTYFYHIIKPNVSIDIAIYLYPEGGIVRLLLNKEDKNELDIIDKETEEEPYKAVKLERFISCTDFSRVHFSGTNIMDNGDELIFIKDNKPSEWTQEVAQKDMLSILKGGQQ